MIKKQLLLLLIALISQSSLKAMLRYCPEAFDDSKISCFGVLSNATAGDKEAHGRFLEGLDPIVLVADTYKKEEILTPLIVDMEVLKDKLKDNIRALNIALGPDGDIDNHTYLSIVRLVPMDNNNLLDLWRKYAVLCSARGSFVRPNHDKFKEHMAFWITDVIRAAVDAGKSALQRSQENGTRFCNAFLDESKKNINLESELEKFKKTHQKLMAENKDLAKDDVYKGTLLGLAVDALNILEKSEADLKAKVSEKEKAVLKIEKEKSELEERNKELQEQKDRNHREKIELTERFEKEIKAAGDRADQKQAFAAIAQLRKELSPLRRQISPLRRQVASQATVLEQKDAEIARLRQALENANIPNNK